MKNNHIFEREWILSRVDFDRENRPRLLLNDNQTGEIATFLPEFGKAITIEIDTRERFCTGWHDLKTGENHTCPEKTALDKKYDQCQNCQKRTGFNPAFYNANEGDLSAQQAERNSQPHFVYLAYFSDKIFKVGISFCGRGKARLLEQGARAALILGEFPSANVARNYEAKISALPDFAENVKSSLKMKLLSEKFDFARAKNKLEEARTKIEKPLMVEFDKNQPIDFSQFYGEITNSEIIDYQECQANSDKIVFSGVLKAQVGYIWLAEQQGEIVAIPLRKFTGYKIKLSPKLAEVELPVRQASLFDF